VTLALGGAENATLQAGSAVGRYLLLALVGRGGMGEIYSAYDPELDRRIAIKLLNVQPASGVTTTEARARLLREAKAIARLSHPNVVVVFDAGIFDERMFMAMELVEGQTLCGWLEARPRSWREVRDVFMAAGRGLAAAHAAGLVHRDFKPQNVMVGWDGKARVTDFGLVRGFPADATAPGVVNANAVPGPSQEVDAALTRAGAVIGTPLYMAPEQFRSEPVDARSDQFSYAVALYEGLYGERPFAGETITSLREAVIAGRMREVPAHRKVPAWLRRVVLRGLRTDRD
jgi:serine/threonine protein kinase